MARSMIVPIYKLKQIIKMDAVSDQILEHVQQIIVVRSIQKAACNSYRRNLRWQ